jgi:hypothetical protein
MEAAKVLALTLASRGQSVRVVAQASAKVAAQAKTIRRRHHGSHEAETTSRGERNQALRISARAADFVLASSRVAVNLPTTACPLQNRGLAFANRNREACGKLKRQ